MRRLLPYGIALLIVAQAVSCTPQARVAPTANSAAVTMSSTGAAEFPRASWPTVTPADAGMHVSLLDRAREYALTGGGSGFIVRYGRRVYAWGDAAAPFELKSATKSLGSIVLGLALRDGVVRIHDRAQAHLPSFGTPPSDNAAMRWLGDITLLHLATMTAGFEKTGGFGALVHEPGTVWRYSDGGSNWLADLLTQVYRRDLDTVFFERVMVPLGISRDRLTWRSNAYRPDTLSGVRRREFASGITSDVDSLARIGYLFLRGGVWEGERILDAEFIDLVRRPVPSVRGLPVFDPANWQGASDRYGVLWMTNDDGQLQDVPRDAYWAHGLGDALIFVIPSLDLVVTRLGGAWRRPSRTEHDVLSPFIVPIVRSMNRGADLCTPPGRGARRALPARACGYR